MKFHHLATRQYTNLRDWSAQCQINDKNDSLFTKIEVAEIYTNNDTINWLEINQFQDVLTNSCSPTKQGNDVAPSIRCLRYYF